MGLAFPARACQTAGMPKSGGDKSRKKGRRAGGPRLTPGLPGDLAIFDSVISEALASGGAELLRVEDPLEAEEWASGLLGMFYKMPLPYEDSVALERSVGPVLVRGAESMRNAKGLAILCALAAVTGDDIGAAAGAARMSARGVPRPRWADVVGAPEFLEGWAMADHYGDQIGYYLTFRYPGRAPHLIMALYDENLGGIIKDAFVADLGKMPDLRERLASDPDAVVYDVTLEEAAARIEAALATNDLYLDNDWTSDFKHTRALLRARLRPFIPARDVPARDVSGRDQAVQGFTEDEEGEPYDDAAVEALIQEFLASPLAPRREETLPIVDHCVIARCDYGDGDPLRWSPIVVELFMLDYLPRHVTLSPQEIDGLPDVLTAWVRFALGKRGLAERFIVETEEAVREMTAEFRDAMNDPERSGMAKRVAAAMRADGVDVMDQKAVEAWLADFNARPDEERKRFFGDSLDVF